RAILSVATEKLAEVVLLAARRWPPPGVRACRHGGVVDVDLASDPPGRTVRGPPTLGRPAGNLVPVTLDESLVHQIGRQRCPTAFTRGAHEPRLAGHARHGDRRTRPLERLQRRAHPRVGN